MKSIITIGVFLATAAAAIAQIGAPVITRAASGVGTLRRTMKDPDSFVLEGVFLKKPNKQGVSEVCYYYRSHNGYGGYANGLSIMLKNGYVMSVDPELAGSFLSPCRRGTRIADITADVVGTLDPGKMQSSQIASPADRPKLIAMFAGGFKKEGVAGYAEILGDTLTLHSERAGSLRFHTLLANTDLMGTIARAGILTFIYTNDAEQNFTYDVKEQQIAAAVKSVQDVAVTPPSPPADAEAMKPVSEGQSLGEIARRDKLHRACLELAKDNPTITCK